MYSGRQSGIARIIERVDADENVGALQHFGPRQREGKEDGVARRDVGDRNAVAHFRRRSGPWARRYRRSAPSRRTRPGRCVATMCRSAPKWPRPRAPRPPVRPVALAVVEGKRVAGVAFAPRQRQASGGIQAAAQQANGFGRSGRGMNSTSIVMCAHVTIIVGATCASASSPPLRSISGAAAAPTWASTCWRARSAGLGHAVEFETPRLRLPVYTLERLVFNRRLRPSPGVRSHGRLRHGRLSHRRRRPRARGLAQRRHRRRSALRTRPDAASPWRCRPAGSACTPSARRACWSPAAIRPNAACELYGLRVRPAVVPEPHRPGPMARLLAEHPAVSSRFTVLYVGRLYRRKRIDVLLRARRGAPRAQSRNSKSASWETAPTRPPGATRPRSRPRRRGHLVGRRQPFRARRGIQSRRSLLPAQRPGRLRDRAAGSHGRGKAIVASRAAAIPEVAGHGLLVEPGSAEALAAAIESLYRSPRKRAAIALEGARRVEQFDAPRVAGLFLEAAAG